MQHFTHQVKADTQGVTVLLAFAGPAVEAATAPARLAALEPTIGTPLRTALTVISRAPTLAHVSGLRSLTLIRLSREAATDYELGNDVTSVTFRPVDETGRPILTGHTKESHMNVIAVVLLAVGNISASAQTA